MEELEQGNTDVQPEASSEPQQEPVESQPAQDSPAQETKPAEEKLAPFHEHPRWKEMLEDRNRERATRESLERKLQDIETRIQQQQNVARGPDERTQLLGRLKEIDPQFGSLMEEMTSKLAKLDALEQTYKTDRSTSLQERYQSNLNSLHSEYKVPKEMQNMYDAQIRAMATNNTKLGLSDLPSVYKQIHDQINSVVEARIRAERASYASAKKTDASVPASQGKAQAPAQAVKAAKTEASKMDPYEARQAVIKKTLSELAKVRSQDNI